MRALVWLKISEPQALALGESVRHRNVIYVSMVVRCRSLNQIDSCKSLRALKSDCWVQLPLKLGILDISPRVDSCTG